METTASDLWRMIGASMAFALRDAPGFEARLTPTGWLLLSGEPVADFNWVMVDEGPDPARQLREYGEVLRGRDLPGLVFLNDSVAERLAPVAAELGLHHAGRPPLMTYRPADDWTGRDAGATSAGRYQVELIADAAGIQTTNQVMARGFGLPPDLIDRVITTAVLDAPGLAIFVAREAGQPISTVMTTQIGSAIGIWNMATLPEHRRRGAGRTLLTHALAYHRAHGANQFFLLATEAGFPLYQQVGFTTLAEPTVWVRGQSVQVADH